MKCSFCGKSQKQVKKLIAGPGVYICDECIDLCNDIIEEELSETSEVHFDELPKPAEIFTFLNDYVIGQERAKKILSVAVYNHYKRVQSGGYADADVELQKSNILLLGPTGCGKTFLAQTLARMLNVPFAIADATALTEAGYVGEDVENILLKLIQAADYDVKKAETGHHLHRRDRQDRPQEREPVDHPGRVRRGRAAGAAQDPGRHDRLGAARRGGASTPTRSSSRSTRPTSCSSAAAPSPVWTASSRAGWAARGSASGPTSAGPPSEARASCWPRCCPRTCSSSASSPSSSAACPVIGAVSNLDRTALVRILVEPKNALVKQYRRVFELDNVELVFSDDALDAVAEQALLRGTGARGLRAILEEVLLEVMYDLPSRTDIGQVRDRPLGGPGAGQPDARPPYRALRTRPRAGPAGPRPDPVRLVGPALT